MSGAINASDLLPCPFCGSDKVRMHRRSGRVGRVCPSRYYREFVKCEGCEATGPVGKKPNVTIGRWNRASESATKARFSVLSKIAAGVEVAA